MADIATRLFKNAEFLLITLNSELESRLVDSVLGNTNLPIKVSGEVCLSDGYGEHYILLETKAQFNKQTEPEPTEFTKELRNEAETLQLYAAASDKRGAFRFRDIFEACDIINSQAAQITDLNKSLKDDSGRIIKLVTLEAENETANLALIEFAKQNQAYQAKNCELKKSLKELKKMLETE